ncbi:collagen alpha-1(XVII) chain-like [Gorilla gorilla gorilla]|uniref:collagen alpha-1(XVII) chain-like n=1 Tax=Gorilla gorilla gorilla TaxID=9595 RepID=UPI00123ECF44|nr:collagen alpha-1(XVII) chain-like [Gorilla gorilla gorilla]
MAGPGPAGLSKRLAEPAGRGKLLPAKCAHTPVQPKSDSAEPGALITFPHAPPARRATGNEPGAPAQPGGGLGRGNAVPLPGWKTGIIPPAVQPF